MVRSDHQNMYSNPHYITHYYVLLGKMNYLYLNKLLFYSQQLFTIWKELKYGTEK